MTRDYLTYIGPPCCINLQSNIVSLLVPVNVPQTVVQLVSQNTYSHNDWTRKIFSVKTSHTGVNNMWILKNSTNLVSSLAHLGSP